MSGLAGLYTRGGKPMALVLDVANLEFFPAHAGIISEETVLSVFTII